MNEMNKSNKSNKTEERMSEFRWPETIHLDPDAPPGQNIKAEAERRWAAYPKLVAALKRISYAKPDLLEHAIDAGTIERAAALAAATLLKLGEDV